MSLIFFVFYSVTFQCAYALAQLIGLVLPSLAYQLRGRALFAVSKTWRRHLADISERIEKEKPEIRVVIFASSAGEYEQAKPLLDRLTNRHRCFMHVVFFSRAGVQFLNSRNEDVSLTLSPADTIFFWWGLFKTVKPDATFVIRHEWWPAFLWTAKKFAKVYLIDASLSNAKRNWISLQLKRRLGSWFSEVYAVSPSQKENLQRELRLAPEKVFALGDTKYDRVKDRADALKLSDATSATSKRLEVLRELAGGRNIFLSGSVHRHDVDVLADVYAATKDQWLFILVPHDVAPEKISEYERALAHKKIAVTRYSKFGSEAVTGVVLVDIMGILAELYSLGDVAYVGGGLHAKVHNVLEPAVHGALVMYGPCFTTSQEAIELQDRGLSVVVGGAGDMVRCLQGFARSEQEKSRRRLALEDFYGASDRIIARVWQQVLT